MASGSLNDILRHLCPITQFLRFSREEELFWVKNKPFLAVNWLELVTDKGWGEFPLRPAGGQGVNSEQNWYSAGKNTSRSNKSISPGSCLISG